MLVKTCKYDETILLDKMTEEISKLRQTFAETGAQLNRIIDAYERGGNIPAPYVPDSFPIYLKVTDVNDPTSYSISMFDDFAQGGVKIVDNGINIAGIYPEDPDNGAEIDIEIEDNPVQIGLLFDDPFRIETTQSDYLVEFVDPSTLPQS